MLHLNLKWRSTATAAAAVAVLSACATDRAGGPLSPGMNAISAQVLGSSNSYIVSSTLTSTFDPFVSDQAGRAAGKEFWDNVSDDGGWNSGTGQGCAIGFYATAMMKSDCAYETAGSYTNSLANTLGNSYKFYWNDAAVMPASFEFSAATTYDVTFKAAYSGGMSVVGYYIKTGGAYAFTPVPSWSNKTISNVSMPVSAPAGSTWGFFIANNRAGTEGIEMNRCGTLLSGSETLNVACSDATGGFVTNPFQQFALFGNTTGTSYLVGAEDKTVRYERNVLDNDSDYNDYIWTVVPRAIVRTCDFMTFGRTQIDAPLGKIVISGNAGGFKADGSILGTFNISVGGTSYLVQDITSYGPITSGVALVGSGYPNARVITGISRSGKAVELRIYDGGEPGRVADEVYLKVDGVEVLGAQGVSLDRGNIQYHNNCRGPG